MTRMNAEQQAERMNKAAPKGVCHYAACIDSQWVVQIHDGRKNK